MIAYETDSDLLVLHALRCIGYADLGRVADATGLTVSDAESELIDLAVAGLVTGSTAGWGLTDAGRVTAAERIADELSRAGTHAVVNTAYDRFLVLNPELLDLCTAWQLRPVEGFAILNDHTDSAYDARLLERLVDLDRRADVACAELVAAMARFRRYRERLTEALDRARAGEREYVIDSTASYHTVWFHLHEDLLATQGIQRW